MNTSEETRLSGQAVALAAVVQSAILVDLLSREGTAPAADMQALSESLFRLEWDPLGFQIRS